jgi:hypothetical protein
VADQFAVEDQRDLVGAADVEVVAGDLLEKAPPDTGASSIWVKQNSGYRIEMS